MLDAIKIIHIVAIISWMAGLLYLPRIFMYHVDVIHGSESDTLLCTMERRLLFYIMTPAMLVSIATGLLLAMEEGVMLSVWLHIKMLCVFFLIVIHGLCFLYRRRFLSNTHFTSKKFFRIFNEMPTILMIIIVIMVIKKPF